MRGCSPRCTRTCANHPCLCTYRWSTSRCLDIRRDLKKKKKQQQRRKLNALIHGSNKRLFPFRWLYRPVQYCPSPAITKPGGQSHLKLPGELVHTPPLQNPETHSLMSSHRLFFSSYPGKHSHLYPTVKSRHLPLPQMSGLKAHSSTNVIVNGFSHSFLCSAVGAFIKKEKKIRRLRRSLTADY